MSQLADRIIRAIRLDPGLYEEVEADRSATGQAMLVVILSSLAGGFCLSNLALGKLLGGAVFALVGWVIWAFVIYVVGARLLPEPQTSADTGELMRTLGFASAPGILRVFGVIPLLGWMAGPVSYVWMLIATVIAVRQALDYRSTGRAVAVCLLGWLPFVILMAVARFLLGGFACPFR